jgi:hypothetical protein
VSKPCRIVSDRKPHSNDEIGPKSEIQPRALGIKKHQDNHSASSQNQRGITPDSVPEARQKLAGGGTTGSARPTTPNRRRALKGREKGTRGLAGNIAGDIRTLLAPLPGRIPYRGWWGGPVPVVPGRSATFTAG